MQVEITRAIFITRYVVTQINANQIHDKQEVT